MQLAKLEQIVGPINRGQLAAGFISEARIAQEKEDRYLDGDTRKVKAPPLKEDFSHLNPGTTKLFQLIGSQGWAKASKADRLKRRKQLSLAGKKGGKTKRTMVVRNRYHDRA